MIFGVAIVFSLLVVDWLGVYLGKIKIRPITTIIIRKVNKIRSFFIMTV